MSKKINTNNETDKRKSIIKNSILVVLLLIIGILYKIRDVANPYLLCFVVLLVLLLAYYTVFRFK